jgi:hypothetical protein
MKIGHQMRYEEFLKLDDDWGLYKIKTKNFNSWVYHTCNPMKAHVSIGRFLTMSELSHSVVKCWKCHQEVSPEVLGLWRLHNFDSMRESLWLDWKQLREYNIVADPEWHTNTSRHA